MERRTSGAPDLLETRIPRTQAMKQDAHADVGHEAAHLYALLVSLLFLSDRSRLSVSFDAGVSAGGMLLTKNSPGRYKIISCASGRPCASSQFVRCVFDEQGHTVKHKRLHTNSEGARR